MRKPTEDELTVIKEVMPTRFAVCRNGSAEMVRPYLPGEYHAANLPDGGALIYGSDYAGWTLDGYIIPRLASGLLVAEEVEYVW